METSGPFRHVLDTYKQNKGEDWLIPGIIPRDGLVVLASAPKTGKTCFATALARAIVKGEDFLGHPTPQGPVIWCAHEETPLERKLLHAGITEEDPFYIAYGHNLPDLDKPESRPDKYGRLNTDYDAPYVFLDAVALGAKLIVIDCLHAACYRLNLAENFAARMVMGRLRRWSLRFGIAVLVLHHLTKSATRGHTPERFADSAQILAAASCHFFLERKDIDENTSRVTLHGQGRNPAPFAKIEIISHGILDYKLAKGEVVPPTKLTVRDRLITQLEEGWPMTANELAQRLQAAPNSVRTILRALLEENRIMPTKDTERNAKYTIRLTGSADTPVGATLQPPPTIEQAAEPTPITNNQQRTSRA